VEETVKRDLSGLSQKELLALFKQTAPEFDGIVLDFKVIDLLIFPTQCFVTINTGSLSVVRTGWFPPGCNFTFITNPELRFSL
jgi:hypothetical protein